MDREEKRKIILDNYNDDINRKEISSSDYIKVNSRNFSCIDNIDLYIKFNNNSNIFNLFINKILNRQKCRRSFKYYI